MPGLYLKAAAIQAGIEPLPQQGLSWALEIAAASHLGWRLLLH